MIALVLQRAPKKDFAIAKVREDAAGGQMPQLLWHLAFDYCFFDMPFDCPLLLTPGDVKHN